MSKRTKLLAAVAVLAVVSPHERARASTNLVVNGGFETGDLTGWSNPNYAWDIRESFNKPVFGNYSAFGNSPYNYGLGHLTQSVSLVSGQTYHMSFTYAGGYIYGNTLTTKIGNQDLGTVLAYNNPFGGNYFHTTFVANGNNTLDLNVNSLSSSFVLDNVSISLYEKPLAVAATNAELARMSSNAYHQSTFKLPGAFDLQTEYTVGTASSGESVFAETYISREQSGEGDQIVVAIRGSLYLQDWLLRNGTFVTGDATVAFSAAAKEVATLIGRIHDEHPNASIMLTGHSMGGALAQAIGQATGIGAVAFDAPGANGTFNAEERRALYALAIGSTGNPLQTPNNNLENIRYFGDEVSKIGDRYNAPGTVMPLTQAERDKIDNLQRYGGFCVFACHSMAGLALALEDGRVPIANSPDFYGSWPSPLIFAAAFIGAEAKVFNYVVNPFARYLFDPSGEGDVIELDMLDSDVSLSHFILPGVSDSYPIWAFSDGDWQYLGDFDGASSVAVPISQLYRVGNAKTLQTEQGAFALGMDFGGIGTFKGSLRMIALSSVPEPDTWILLIFGFAAVGLLQRRQLKSLQRGRVDFNILAE